MKTRFIILYFLIIGGLISFPSVAQQNLGKIDFKPSGTSVAQPYFHEGLLLLHSFEYDDAIEQFKMAQLLDPDFVMAFWGEAMCYNHPIWHTQEYEKGRGVLLKLGIFEEDRLALAKNDLEKGFLRAVEELYREDETKIDRDKAYSQAMKELHGQFPGENEVTAFYALSVLGLAYQGRDIELYDQAAELCKEVLKTNPYHPGALHYLIHAYDDPLRAHNGLEAAEKYGNIAPDSEHALHMPSHIYVALGMWMESVKANEASFAVADERVVEKKLSLDDRGYHSYWWLEYSYLQQGRFDKAKEMVRSMYQDARMSKSARTRFHFTVMRAAYMVESNNWNSEIFNLDVPTAGLRLTTKMANMLLDGLKAYHNSDLNRLNWVANQMTDQLTMEKNSSTIGKEIAVCGNNYSERPTTEADMNLATAMELEVKGLAAYMSGNEEEAIEHFEKACELEQKTPFMFGPPVVAKPTFELYGEVLLKMGKPEKAIEMFDISLERAPNRTLSLIGKYNALKYSSQTTEAGKLKNKIMSNWIMADNQVKTSLN